MNLTLPTSAINSEGRETLKFCEFEVKFKVEGDLIYEFKKLVSQLEGCKDFVYVESDDIYYVKDNEFLRHRFSNFKKDKRSELTFKRKLNSDNNIKRVEYNVRVDNNSIESIAGFAKELGFDRNFRISKIAHIYKFDDAVVPFYTVIDEQGKMAHFIEVEVNEELLENLTEAEAWVIIEKYEKLLVPLGLTPQKRLRKSLFDMYRKLL